MKYISREQPKPNFRPLFRWSSVLALATLIAFDLQRFAVWLFTAWVLCEIYWGYRQEMVRISQPLLEHQRKYRKWYEEQAARRVGKSLSSK